MKTLLKAAAIATTLASTSLFASFEGINQEKFDQYDITGFSRPCCTFSPNYINKKLGLSKVIDPKNIGPHDFGRFNKVNDTVGILYSCQAGFLDISHLRDNADWSAHVYFNLDKWLGSGKDVLARREGGFKSRSIYFPELSKEDIESLTDDDKEKISVAVGFTMALLHEIPTAFKIPVSEPGAVVIFEQSSAFSVEDAYSNLLGNILGAKAARDSRPYNIAMEALLNEKLEELKAQSPKNTDLAYQAVKGSWWKDGFASGLQTVLKRNYDFQNEINPILIEEAPFCSNTAAKTIEVPHVLSNGKTVNDYYQLRAVMKKQLIKNFEKAGIHLNSNEFSQIDYPELINKLEVQLEDKLEKSRRKK